jgi:SAM-dependent methyltransferase
MLAAPSGIRFPINAGVPRFVEADPGYLETFGEQWNRYRRVQLDSATGQPHSRRRLLEGTGWRLEALAGQRILEAGCGAGRFTEILLEAGAEVWAVDGSAAVDACWRNHGPHPNLVVLQADLFALPFPRRSFDRVLCYGVLQHTPDPKRAFFALIDQLRPGGSIAADVYARPQRLDRWNTRYVWRWLTTRLDPDLLRRIIEWYVPKWLPIDTRLARLPKVGRLAVSIVPCWNYTGVLALSPADLEAWAVLDTFDALASRYDKPQSLAEVQGWCHEAALRDVSVRYGGNGILINALAPE